MNKEIIENVAIEAGERALSWFGNLNAGDIDLKGEVDLVTQADRDVEDLIKNKLAEAFPDVAFFGEETGLDRDNTEEYFVVDPIDGTTNFVHGHPFFSISIALVSKTTGAKIGVVNAPALNRLYSAEMGKGAFRNNKPIQVSSNSRLIDCLAATGFACVRSRLKDDGVKIFDKMIYEVRGIRRCGSAAIDLCLTAEGVYDIFWELNLSPWDVSAGALIVNEAGGTVTDFKGEIDFTSRREIIASNPQIHPVFLNFLRNCK